MSNSNEGKNPIDGLTYFYEFIRQLEKQYAWASVASVAEEIAFARTVGPSLAGLEQNDDGVYLLKAPIGRGHYAIVELEFDREGVLQPVMGGFMRK